MAIKTAFVTKLKKGDRVTFIDPQTKAPEYGVVIKGGSKNIRVIKDGGKIELSGNIRAFARTNKPLPKDKPNSMDKWSVSGYKSFEEMSDETTCFHAVIRLNGVAVLTAENRGEGGCNFYHGKREYQEQFVKDAKEWVKKFGYPDMIEPEDTWIEWYVNYRPYGVTGEQHIKEYKKEMDELCSR